MDCLFLCNRYRERYQKMQRGTYQMKIVELKGNLVYSLSV